jgi:hypothetical protein
MPLLKNSAKYGRRTFAAALNKRCAIQRLDMTPTDPSGDGIFSTAPLEASYTTLVSIWCQIVDNSQNDYLRAIRGVNAAEDITHYIRVRLEAIKYLGASMTDGFNAGFKTMDDMNPIKSEYFVLLETAIAGRGRRLRILGLARDEANTEFLVLKCSEMRETGTGYGN